MHVYHYAPYEPTALKRLMGRYGTREAEVDRLLREGVMVDLLRVVRQSLRASVESYSIKKMEAFYDFTREIDLRDAGSSIVAFEEWLELGEGDRPEATHLDRIERYNRDDVVSNLRLRDWLETLRGEFTAQTGLDVPRPVARDAELPADLTEAQARVEALVERLAGPDVVPTDPAERTPSQQATWLLGQLLGWHRREDKSMWWDFHRQLDLTPEQLVDEDDPIGLLEPVGPLDDEKKGKQTWRYPFPAQDYDLGRGEVYDPANKQARPNDSPVQLDRRRRSRGRCCEADRGLPADRERAAPACHRPAELGPDEGSPGVALRPRRVGRRPRDRGARTEPCRTRPAVQSPAARRPMAGRRALSGRRVRPRGRASARPRARPHDPRHPGPARLGQDLHRGADDLLAA